MAAHNRRDIPHPVMQPGGRDYRPGTAFSAALRTVRKPPGGGRIAIAVEYELSSPVLAGLIGRGKAHYTTLTESVTGRIREAHRTDASPHSIVLDGSRYPGTVGIRSYITAGADMERFPPDDWSQAIRSILPEGTPVPKGAILAVATEKVFETDGARDLRSCVEIVVSAQVEERQYRIDIGGERINILVNGRDKQDIDRTRSDEGAQQALWPSIYQRAIEEAVRMHTQPEHSDRRWAKTIAAKLAERGIETGDPDVLRDNSLAYTQTIMDNPLFRIIEEGRGRYAE